MQLPERAAAGEPSAPSPVLGRQHLHRQDTAGLTAKDTVNIQKDCGEDNICIPDLKIIHSR